MDNKLKIATNILKENAMYLAPVILVLILFVNFVVPKFSSSIEAAKLLKTTKTQYEQLSEQLNMLKIQQSSKSSQKNASKDGKVIYSAPDMQFSTDASFAPLFEFVLTIAQQSGIRIRSIDYNYAPSEDMVFAAKLEGYNSCELNMLAVGSYSEFQIFFKTLMKEPYLTNIAEIELNPWEKDKKVLIAKIKLRLYTHTMPE